MNSIYFKALKHIQTAVWRKVRGKAHATMSKVIMGNGVFYDCLTEPAQGISAWWKESVQTRVRSFSFLIAKTP